MRPPLESGFDDPTLPGQPEGQRAPCPEGGSNAAPPFGQAYEFTATEDHAGYVCMKCQKHFSPPGTIIGHECKPPVTWCISSDEEHYEGSFPTRELAILEGRALYPGKRFWVGQAAPAPSPESFWFAYAWLDHVSDQDEYLGDWADGWERSTPKQRAELEELVRPILGAWLDRHGIRPRFFTVLKAEEIDPWDEEEDQA